MKARGAGLAPALALAVTPLGSDGGAAQNAALKRALDLSRHDPSIHLPFALEK